MKIVHSREGYLREVKTLLQGEITAVELGVLNGDFSQMILDVLKPIKLFLVDPFEVNDEKYDNMNITTAYSTERDFNLVLYKFEKEIFSNQVDVVKGYSYDVVKCHANNSIDFIYIDASHLYKDVKRDLNDWLPKLKEKCLICGHDYIKHESFGVIQAVDEFCKEYDFEMILFNEHGGDFALKNKAWKH